MVSTTGGADSPSRMDWLHNRYRIFAWAIQTTFLAWSEFGKDEFRDFWQAGLVLLVLIWGVMVQRGYYLQRNPPKGVRDPNWITGNRWLRRADKMLNWVNFPVIVLLVMAYFLLAFQKAVAPNSLPCLNMLVSAFFE